MSHAWQLRDDAVNIPAGESLFEPCACEKCNDARRDALLDYAIGGLGVLRVLSDGSVECIDPLAIDAD